MHTEAWPATMLSQSELLRVVAAAASAAICVFLLFAAYQNDELQRMGKKDRKDREEGPAVKRNHKVSPWHFR